MAIFPIVELSLIGVADPAVPNQERIILRPTQHVDLTNFAIIVGHKTKDGLTFPFRDQFFWFGNLEVDPPSWLFVYTGPGEFQKTQLQNTDEPAFSFHWGRPYTIFNSPETIPLVIRMDAILVGEKRLFQEKQLL